MEHIFELFNDLPENQWHDYSCQVKRVNDEFYIIHAKSAIHVRPKRRRRLNRLICIAAACLMAALILTGCQTNQGTAMFCGKNCWIRSR